VFRCCEGIAMGEEAVSAVLKRRTPVANRPRRRRHADR
jgi:hypothetical protein